MSGVIESFIRTIETVDPPQGGHRVKINDRVWKWSYPMSGDGYLYVDDENDTTGPGVMCRCGGISFILSFHGHSTKAHCLCGAVFVVHEG